MSQWTEIDSRTQAQVQALNDGLVAVITLLNELRAAVVEKGIVKGGGVPARAGLSVAPSSRNPDESRTRVLRDQASHHADCAWSDLNAPLA